MNSYVIAIIRNLIIPANVFDLIGDTSQAIIDLGPQDAVCRRVMTFRGIGPVTSLAFISPSMFWRAFMCGDGMLRAYFTK